VKKARTRGATGERRGGKRGKPFRGLPSQAEKIRRGTHGMYRKKHKQALNRQRDLNKKLSPFSGKQRKKVKRGGGEEAIKQRLSLGGHRRSDNKKKK